MFRSDVAENSIMQTVTVAVSAILIAAGTVTVPNIIGTVKEGTVKTQLANFAFAQQSWIAAYGYANSNIIPGEDNDAVIPNGKNGPKKENGDYAVAGDPVPNLSNWKYPYDFSDFAFQSVTGKFDCYNNQYYVTAVSYKGETWYITSSTTVASKELDMPETCAEGYIPVEDDVVPTLPDVIAAPTNSPTGIAISSDRETLSWNAVTCAEGLPTYQIRASWGTNNTGTGTWSSSNSQSVLFLGGVPNEANVNFVVAAKCRTSTGALSANETVSATFTSTP